jgi:endonuclease/exonuclease/phosphatase (EEP) superfamily protein YafD
MVGVVWIYVPLEQPGPGSETLKVMSFNVLVRNSEYQEVSDLIKQIDPDVVAFLEYSENWYQALDGLSEQYPHHVARPRWHGFGIAIYSKYPLSNLEVIQLTQDETDNPFVVADVTFKNQNIRLAAFHALSPINRYRMDLRNRQLAEVAQYLARRDAPTVVMGDFNCTPWSPFLNDFLNETGFRDSRQGFGYQATWHAGYWPLRIPIDHAFVSDEIHVHSRYVGPNAGSDHFPIVFEISTIR